MLDLEEIATALQDQTGWELVGWISRAVRSGLTSGTARGPRDGRRRSLLARRAV